MSLFWITAVWGFGGFCPVTVQILAYQVIRMHKIQGSRCCWGVLYLEMLCRHTWSNHADTLIFEFKWVLFCKGRILVFKALPRLNWHFKMGDWCLNCPWWQMKESHRSGLHPGTLLSWCSSLVVLRDRQGILCIFRKLFWRGDNVIPFLNLHFRKTTHNMMKSCAFASYSIKTYMSIAYIYDL